MDALNETLLEALAELEHQQWIYWSANLAEVEKISEERLDRWSRLWVPYAKLPEKDKEPDRRLAWRVLQLTEIKRALEARSKLYKIETALTEQYTAMWLTKGFTSHDLKDEWAKDTVNKIVKILLKTESEVS